tara:strand:+ start:2324 stop:3112 length:789 start_codon:yes stop_codon:yes gene_type:complete
MKVKDNNFDNHNTFFDYYNLKSKKIPTIFIHGVGLNNTMWIPQKKFFHDQPIIFYDLLNHGKTKKGYKKLNFKDFINQINFLVKFLKIKKFNLVGFSIGSLIAQHYAAKFYKKLNKLVLIASIHKRSKEQVNKVKKRFKLASKGSSITKNSINRWFNKEYLNKNPSVSIYFEKILNSKNNKDFLPAYKLFVEADKYSLNFANIKIKTLLITGENDVGSTVEMSSKIQKKIRGSKLFIIPKAKHMASFEKAKEVNKEIYKFLI